jgi:hypothetical protein
MALPYRSFGLQRSELWLNQPRMRFGKNTTHKKTAADWGGGHSTQFSKILNNQGDVILPATTNAIRPVAEAIAVAEGAFPRIGRYRNSDRLGLQL